MFFCLSYPKNVMVSDKLSIKSTQNKVNNSTIGYLENELEKV